MFPVALLFLVYSLAVYHWRANKIRRKEGGAYDDRVGPTVLLLALFSAMVINMVMVLDTSEQPVIRSYNIATSPMCRPVIRETSLPFGTEPKGLWIQQGDSSNGCRWFAGLRYALLTGTAASCDVSNATISIMPAHGWDITGVTRSGDPDTFVISATAPGEFRRSC